MADGLPPVEGVDYTGGANIAQLAAAGKVFACRYGGPGGAWKHLTLAEAQALSRAGVSIVANAEGSATGLINGFPAGASWAREAEAHFLACGMPPDRPIYFSVDFDTTSGDWAKLDAAMDGAASVIGRERVGVYGEFSIIEHFASNGKARWFWQTLAWSGSKWSRHNHIEQYHNDVPLAGIRLDLNRAYGKDFGQWMIGADDMTPDQAAKLEALYQIFIPDPPVRVQGAWTHTRPDGRSVPINPLYNAIDGVAEKVEKLAKPTAPPPAQVDIAALVAALRPELQAAAEAAVRRVLGALDETDL